MCRETGQRKRSISWPNGPRIEHLPAYEILSELAPSPGDLLCSRPVMDFRYSDRSPGRNCHDSRRDAWTAEYQAERSSMCHRRIKPGAETATKLLSVRHFARPGTRAVKRSRSKLIARCAVVVFEQFESTGRRDYSRRVARRVEARVNSTRRTLEKNEFDILSRSRHTGGSKFGGCTGNEWVGVVTRLWEDRKSVV